MKGNQLYTNTYTFANKKLPHGWVDRSVAMWFLTNHILKLAKSQAMCVVIDSDDTIFGQQAREMHICGGALYS